MFGCVRTASGKVIKVTRRFARSTRYSSSEWSWIFGIESMKLDYPTSHSDRRQAEPFLIPSLRVVPLLLNELIEKRPVYALYSVFPHWLLPQFSCDLPITTGPHLRIVRQTPTMRSR